MLSFQTLYEQITMYATLVYSTYDYITHITVEEYNYPNTPMRARVTYTPSETIDTITFYLKGEN